jgi:hypothetical protein
MPAPAELTKVLDKQRKTHSSSSAATSTVAAANATFDARELAELERAAVSQGYDVTLSAGAVVLQPKG